MPILNYTTQVKTEKTCGEIQKTLAVAGAKAIMHEYDDDGVLVALSFKIQCHDIDLAFRLPANIGKIYTILQNDSRVTRKLRTYDQAARVAWRIIKDWVEAQCAIVEAEQADMAEVFLPYVQDPRTGKTMYKTMIEKNHFKQLEAPK